MASFHYSCVECNATYPEDPSRLLCDSCAALQEAGGTTRGVLEVVIEELPGSWDTDGYSGFLPLRDTADLPPIPVGNTPLVEARTLGETLAVKNLWVKDDTRNPSGSTKDRASQLVVAKATEYGIDTIAAASTGNAATALAAMAAAAGKRAVAFVPASAPIAKLVQMQVYGATLIPVAGTYDDAFDLCLAACKEFGWYNRNTALNPFTTEGKKTLALEIAGQMAPLEPDVVVVPTGDGVIISGVAKGFSDLVRAGLLSTPPRLIAAQPERSAAIAKALIDGTSNVESATGDSVADSLNVGMPRNAIQCLNVVRENGGTGVIVTDDEILQAISLLARTTGIFAEPAGATAVAGLQRGIQTGVIKPDERVVLAVTGTGLKDIAAAKRTVGMPDPIEPTLEAVAGLLDEG